jgi:radical SAM superfamily enzyme YgiQ (UPF0313 family)
VVEVLSRYKEAGIKRFFFVDNTFNFPPSYAKALCESIVQADLGILWHCIIYPNRVDNELVELMAKAGCDEVSLGFESGSTDILRIMNKKFLPKDVRRISERFKTNGIRQMGFLLLGGPGETRETVEESVAFAESLELETMKVSAGIRIYPHTALARTAVEDGMIAPDDDLLFPRYYMVKEIEDWLKHRTNRLLSERPNWVN